MVSCVEKPLCLSDFIIPFLFSFVGLLSMSQLQRMELNADFIAEECGLPFDAYLARCSTQA